MNLWKFSNIPCIEESNFNKALERFYNLGISGLVRENIQNSLDGKLPYIASPVRVIIKTGEIHKGEIPGLEELKERITSLKGKNSYTKETIDHMRKKMNTEIIKYISFEDSNTKGLKGAINGQSDNKEDTWSSYAYNKGVHHVEEDEALEQQRGGSHGIGKIASNAASDIYMMFFANCDEYGNKHLGGTIQLIEHEYKGKHYRSTGYFTDIKNLENTPKFYPYENTFDDVFKKDTRGLKIVIPFLREQFNNEKEIIKSVCDSFFIAILNKKLEVVINEKLINSETIESYIRSEVYYIQELGKIKEDFTPLYYNTYSNTEPVEIKISDKRQAYKFKLYFNYDIEIPKGRVAIIRTVGMKIEDKKITGNANKPFNAVLIPDSVNEDGYLKSLENESHTKISDEHIKDQELQKNAKRFINNISREISKVIEEEIKKSNPTDGIMNTGDILYVVENQFKQELSKSTSTVKINKGSKIKTITKNTSELRKGKKQDEDNKPRKPNEPKDKPKDNPPKIKRIKEKEGYEKAPRYKAHPDLVQRVIFGNDEHVSFDFSSNEEVKKIKKCNIALAVIDGMGVEYPDEFILKENYVHVVSSTGERYEIENNVIKNIKIDKGIVDLRLKLKDKYNRALKFVYYVEVV